ncbi:MAG: hypothetical protein H6621_00985 [Halobacteriovoraceae bacterium]|nr:hypothetical protein [Halobacteriovoraceae bacterium]MCB9093616.1 hypothetical protein [Halobacteriovoraceae bacterium]
MKFIQRKFLFFICWAVLFNVQAWAGLNLTEKFALVRRVIKEERVMNFLSEVFSEHISFTEEEIKTYDIPEDVYKNLTETQLLAILDKHTEIEKLLVSYASKVLDATQEVDESLRDKFKVQFKEIVEANNIQEEIKNVFKSTMPYVIDENIGRPKLYFTHEILDPSLDESHPRFSHFVEIDGKEVPVRKEDNVLKRIVEFIDGAEKEIVVNVYDFDLDEIADALIKKKKQGLKVTVGIDAGVIEHKVTAKAIYQKLQKAGIETYAVNSVGLNHQKMIAIDWTEPKKAKALFSSGNFTTSGIHPDGDLAGRDISKLKIFDYSGELIAEEKLRKLAKPNANHCVIFDSYALANIIRHQTYYTLEMGLRGSEYPISGAFKVIDSNSDLRLFLSFAPQGALDNINKNFIGTMVRKSDGSQLAIAIFAMSSDELSDEILLKLKERIASKKEIDFKVVGDPPFAAMDWSELLKMIGYKVAEDPMTGLQTYVEDEESLWVKELGKRNIDRLRNNSVFTGSAGFGNFTFRTNESPLEISVKVHHKVLVTNEASIIGGSFNFSDGAESNNEQILAMVDSKSVQKMKGAVDYLAYQAKEDGKTLIDVIEAKNRYILKKIQNAKYHIDRLKKLLVEDGDFEEIKKEVSEIRREVGDKKLQNIVVNLGEEIEDFHPKGQETQFIFKLEGNVLNLKEEDFNEEYLKKLLENDKTNWRGDAWNEFVWAMKNKASAEDVILVTDRDPEMAFKLFSILKENKILKNIPQSKNIRKVSGAVAIEKIIEERLSSLNKKKIEEHFIEMKSPNGKGAGKYHLLTYSDNNEADFEEIKKILSKKMDQWDKIKLALFFNHDTASSKSRNFILYPGGSRELEMEEILEWKKTLYKNCNHFLKDPN